MAVCLIFCMIISPYQLELYHNSEMRCLVPTLKEPYMTRKYTIDQDVIYRSILLITNFDKWLEVTAAAFMYRKPYEESAGSYWCQSLPDEHLERMLDMLTLP